MARGGSRDNNGFRQRASKTSNDMTKRSMSITKKEDIDRDFEDKIIDWVTFYRRNLHRFIEHYFGLELFLYQKIMIYLMNLSPLVVLICARAIAKSYITSVFACAICVLYPNSKVVITAKLKKTGKMLVSEKIQKELMTNSPNLCREIKDIKTSQNEVEVIFHNGSSIIVTPCNDDARGIRSTVLITD